MTWFRLLKLLHLTAVTLWLGGACVIAALVFRLARARDRSALASLIRHAGFYGRAVVGPASVLAFVTGMGMLGVLGLSAAELWVQWGLLGIFGHFVLGAFFIRRATLRLGAVAALPHGDDADLDAAGRRLLFLNVAYLALLFSTVGAMALKPSL